jgi:CubicO group peptidase (beta-lactamase class C family)
MTDLAPLPQQPTDTPWPTKDWPLGDVPAGADAVRLNHLLDHAFAPEQPDELRESHALVVIHRGRLVAERYAPGIGPSDTLPSWSIAKSITQALLGLVVADGRIDIHAPAPVPEWPAGDPRRATTTDLLLRMSSGLAFVEEYRPGEPSDTIAMLFGDGKDDVARYAALKPLEHAPGTFWAYSSGSANLAARAASIALDRFGPALEAYLRARLFEPLGMTSAVPKCDTAGTFIGSSYCFAAARDFARFGLLYLRDGMWDGQRLLPQGWVDYARTATFQQPTDGARYGASWWLDLAGPGSFSANGYQGQYVVVVPQRDLVIVRLGATPDDALQPVKDWIRAVAECFAAP